MRDSGRGGARLALLALAVSNVLVLPLSVLSQEAAPGSVTDPASESDAVTDPETIEAVTTVFQSLSDNPALLSLLAQNPDIARQVSRIAIEADREDGDVSGTVNDLIDTIEQDGLTSVGNLPTGDSDNDQDDDDDDDSADEGNAEDPLDPGKTRNNPNSASGLSASLLQALACSAAVMIMG